MLKTAHIFFLILLISCNNKEIDHSKDDDKEIQKIGNLYYPKTINTGPVKSDSALSKKSYEITIFDSDLLQKDSASLENHSKKIALLYRNFLIQNKYNYNDVIIRIHQKDGTKHNFIYSEKQLSE